MSEPDSLARLPCGTKSPARGSKVMDVEYCPTPGEPGIKLEQEEAKKPAASKKKASTTAKKRKSTSSKKKTAETTNSLIAKTPAPAAAAATTDDNASTAAKKKPPSPKKKLTMVQMVHNAIVSLGDRTGSSQIAICKYLLKEEGLEDSRTFRSRLNLALKSAVKQQRFKKIRNSYKIDAAYLRKERSKQKRSKQKQSEKEKKRLALEAQKQKLARQQELEAKMTDEEKRAYREKLEREKQALRKKERAAKLAKERAERIKKRRFPMEDTKLHAEDKELGVKPPDDVTKRPALPYFFHATFEQTSKKGKTPSTILSSSKCDSLEHGSWGLVPDVLSVYHFFRGDVSFASCSGTDEALVPEFTLQHLLYAVTEIVNGNAKRSRMLPPLLSHLFVTCLKLVTSPPTTPETAHERRLQRDLQKLAAGLSPTSWGEVCVQYMNAMERFYTTDASVDPNVLPSGVVDVQYLMRATQFAEPMTPAVLKSDVAATAPPLPDGYGAYLGMPHSALARAHAKLKRQDAWNLSAEELLALLRALTDDVLATFPEIGRDLQRRSEEISILLKQKRAADSQFRKVRLAYEGPKQPSKKKPAAAAKEESPPKEGAADGKTDENKENDKADEESAFKPTATKKQFETAKKAQQKAHDAYEKGLRTLTARTEPVGYDRNHDAVYYFNHDPDMLYVEVSKPSATTTDDRLPSDMLMKRYSWHVIDSKSLFDSYTSSLDIRGTRENDLYDALLGPVGGNYSLKRGLYDDLKEERDKAARVREREELERRLQNAKIACQAEEDGAGRRSGRLQSRAQIDLCQVEKEIKELEKRIAADSVPRVPDYEELTGLELLRKFDAVGRRETRRTRERKAASVNKAFPDMPCTQLIPSGNIDESGVVGWVVSEMLKLEETCNDLSPWERLDISRERWIADLEDRVLAWNSGSQMMIGPPPKRDVDDASETGSIGTPMSKSSDTKRRRLDDGSPSSTASSQSHSASPSQILSMLKSPLLDLEQRVFEITGLATATKDADEADDNMSATSEDERSRQEQKEKLAWKKKINTLRYIETKRFSQIREIVVEAITAARKAQLGSVVAKLRSALLLHRPNAAGECKTAALVVLDSHGGYHEEDDDSDDESETEEEVIEEEEEDVQSLLSAEAMMITGSLAGDDDADRIDWIDAVKNCKTFSRLSALAFAFIRSATKRLEKVEEESSTLWDALSAWEKQEERRARSRSGKAKAPSKKEAESEDPVEVWANVRFTDEFCMAKVGDYPFWPAKKCEAKDEELKNSLHGVGRTLVSLIGEQGGLRVVRLEDIRPFTGETKDEELDEQPKSIRTQLDECMVMARRIVRGRKNNSPGVETNYLEEKKMAM